MKKPALEAECTKRNLATDSAVKALRKRLLDALAATRQASGTDGSVTGDGGQKEE